VNRLLMPIVARGHGHGSRITRRPPAGRNFGFSASGLLEELT
jgi:hypothetical protein